MFYATACLTASVSFTRAALFFLPTPLFSPSLFWIPPHQAVTKSRQITWGDFAFSPCNGALTPPSLLPKLPASAHAARELLVAVSSASLKWWRARRGASSSLEGDSSKPFSEARRYRRWLLRLHIALPKREALWNGSKGSIWLCDKMYIQIT